MAEKNDRGWNGRQYFYMEKLKSAIDITRKRRVIKISANEQKILTTVTT